MLDYVNSAGWAHLAVSLDLDSRLAGSKPGKGPSNSAIANW
ncbi:hypothetical protein YSA_11026 [Pseudomonas putida ND6]|uniref:Uncharacterized protein n=1 Tax=Pseudomonas putida ND6 TaxID=231023 RepID=I3V4S7_PSEPU|nr:hypothetical protein YSA_11026 [Pseudomonas putida ND6]